MAAKEDELAAALVLAFADIGYEAVAAVLNKAVPERLYWPTVRGWMKLNGDQAVVLAAEDIVSSLDDEGFEPVKSLAEIRTAANKKCWDCEIDDKLWETLGYHRDDIRKELLDEGFIKEKVDGAPNGDGN